MASLSPAWASGNQLRSGESPVVEAEEELGPELFVFGVPNRASSKTSRLPSAATAAATTTARDTMRCSRRARVGVVEPHIRERGVIEQGGYGRHRLRRRSRTRSGTPSTSRSRIQPRARTRWSTLRVEVPVTWAVMITAHNAWFAPSARLEQRREERPHPRIWDLEFHIPRWRQQDPGSCSLAPIRPRLSALMWLSTDMGSELSNRLDLGVPSVASLGTTLEPSHRLWDWSKNSARAS